MLSDERLARIDFSERNKDRDVFREVDLRARRHMSQDRTLSYKQAVHAVFTADEDLHRAYLDDCTPVHLAR